MKRGVRALALLVSSSRSRDPLAQGVFIIDRLTDQPASNAVGPKRVDYPLQRFQTGMPAAWRFAIQHFGVVARLHARSLVDKPHWPAELQPAPLNGQHYCAVESRRAHKRLLPRLPKRRPMPERWNAVVRARWARRRGVLVAALRMRAWGREGVVSLLCPSRRFSALPSLLFLYRVELFLLLFLCHGVSPSQLRALRPRSVRASARALAALLSCAWISAPRSLVSIDTLGSAGCSGKSGSATSWR
jgi:hypothetical protein